MQYLPSSQVNPVAGKIKWLHNAFYQLELIAWNKLSPFRVRKQKQTPHSCQLSLIQHYALYHIVMRVKDKILYMLVTKKKIM